MFGYGEGELNKREKRDICLRFQILHPMPTYVMCRLQCLYFLLATSFYLQEVAELTQELESLRHIKNTSMSQFDHTNELIQQIESLKQVSL